MTQCFTIEKDVLQCTHMNMDLTDCDNQWRHLCKLTRAGAEPEGGMNVDVLVSCLTF